ncbi:site-specific tyrosine recombinase XerD [Odoribacter lunatus]|uniref:site-specific tyrosine recombinase XerD n=1 Tax=Odoribacter lunatus TaxID=2941335 RepID=UPI00203CC064|nr:site-specific tyrosine recombinase XerD [Odoribacter lunatus]
MTWENAIENYKTYLILEKSLSANSVEAYLNDIRKLAKFCEDNHKQKDIEKVSYDLLKDYLSFVSDMGVTHRTQARSISSIRSFFKFLVYDGILENNPTKLLEAPKIGRKLPSVLTVEEVDAILNAVEMYKPEGQRNKAIVETLYSCGLRVSELISVKISNINFRMGIIRIEGKGNKERIIPLSKNAKQEIKLYMKGYRSYLDIQKGYEDILFLNKRGTSLSRVMVFNIIKHVAERAHITKAVSPHTFRHSFASHLVTRGADLRAVQDMLGHESILTTEIYTHLDNNYLKETINKYHPRVKGNENKEKEEEEK